MKNLKKLLSMFLADVMLMGLATGCAFGGDDEGEGENKDAWDFASQEIDPDTGLPYMTKENIELTYFNFDSEVLTQELAKRFEAKYPNIKVNVVYVTANVSNDTLSTMVSSGETPDCFMFTDCDFALSNELLGDMTWLWEHDKENENLLPTINELKLGYFYTDQKWATPMKFFPGIIFVDKNVVKHFNLEMPTVDWTWDEMITLIKQTTDKTVEPAYYGLGVYNRLDSYYGIAASQDIVGEFGFNGKTFDLSVWAVGEQEFADLKLQGYVAPDRETQAMEDWLDNWDGWAGASGRVAIMTEAYWTYLNLFDTDAYKVDLGVNFVPYPIPSVEEVEGVANTIATLDFGGISATTEHPREAYELLKWMGWGVDGWTERIKLYADESFTNSSGLPLIRDSVPAPITLDEEIWAAYKEFYYDGTENDEYWDTYFANCIRPVPFGWLAIPGYWTFCDQYFNSIGIHNLVDTGAAKAADYADEATAQANAYHAEAMMEYFGIDINE